MDYFLGKSGGLGVWFCGAKRHQQTELGINVQIE
jgi:hypothetical protein